MNDRTEIDLSQCSQPCDINGEKHPLFDYDGVSDEFFMDDSFSQTVRYLGNSKKGGEIAYWMSVKKKGLDMRLPIEKCRNTHCDNIPLCNKLSDEVVERCDEVINNVKWDKPYHNTIFMENMCDSILESMNKYNMITMKYDDHLLEFCSLCYGEIIHGITTAMTYREKENNILHMKIKNKV